MTFLRQINITSVPANKLIDRQTFYERNLPSLELPINKTFLNPIIFVFNLFLLHVSQARETGLGVIFRE